ncbi:MAG TPA: hypothetical protein VK891_04060 [Euzebyales bacterium]|nr:hypothetical protein [Euzebyales bacterium]
MASPSGRRGSAALLGPLALGLVLGGSASALGFWLLSGLAQPVWVQVRVALLVAVAVAAMVDETLHMGWRWPQHARQVPQAIRRRAPSLGLLQFGFELGTGLRTFVTSKAPYVVVALLLLGGLSVVEALALGVGFGIGRALMPVTRAWHGSTADWDRRLERTSGALKLAATALGGCAAVWVAVVGLP